MGKWTRRAIITSGSLLGGGLLLGVGTVLLAPNRLTIRPPEEDGATELQTDRPAALTTWLRITSDGAITVLVPHCEMGQGAQTGLAMLLAEELDANWEQVRIEEAPALDEYANGYLLRTFLLGDPDLPSWLIRSTDWATWKAGDVAGLMITGGSASIRSTGVYGMQVAGAAARQMLLQAAAQQWSLPQSELSTENSMVQHAASGRRASYAQLAAAAAKLAPPQHPPLKPAKDWRIVGSKRARSDLPSKVTGKAIYAIDVWMEGLLYAAVRGAALPGARLLRVDHAPALAVPGVKQVVELHDAVAVVADSYWRAEQALRLLEPQFGEAPAGAAEVTSASLSEAHRRIILVTDGARKVQLQVDDADTQTVKAVSAEYAVPYLAHATLEPMSATARVQTDRCEVWSGTQDPLNARAAAAKAAGLSRDQVSFHNQQVGGGFGRRLPFCFDYIEQAVHIAKRMSPAPVKLIWSREQDLRHDYYRSACMARFDGAVNAGAALSWYSRSTGPSGMDAALPLYRFEQTEVQTEAAPAHLRLGSWRSVEFSQHVFFNESFMDELAHAAGADPLEFRLAHLRPEQARHAAVLRQAAQMADWSSPRSTGSGLGIALTECFGTLCAQVAEVDCSGAEPRVTRVWAAVDCGRVVDPDQGLAQIEGGILFGLSAALLQAITIESGVVQQSSFPDYPSLLLAQAPRVQVSFIDSAAPLGGLGEPGVPPIAPAVANAIFAASGRRLRRLPLLPAWRAGEGEGASSGEQGAA